jgi:hypothetical protein
MAETKAILANVIPKERPYTTATPHLCIPVAEAREFLNEVIAGLEGIDKDAGLSAKGHKVLTAARALLAVLPEEE